MFFYVCCKWRLKCVGDKQMYNNINLNFNYENTRKKHTHITFIKNIYSLSVITHTHTHTLIYTMKWISRFSVSLPKCVPKLDGKKKKQGHILSVICMNIYYTLSFKQNEILEMTHTCIYIIHIPLVWYQRLIYFIDNCYNMNTH